MDVIVPAREADNLPSVHRDNHVMARVDQEFLGQLWIDRIVEHVRGDALKDVVVAGLKNFYRDRHAQRYRAALLSETAVREGRPAIIAKCRGTISRGRRPQRE